MSVSMEVFNTIREGSRVSVKLGSKKLNFLLIAFLSS